MTAHMHTLTHTHRNFFLAIVVDGYAKIQQAVQDNDAENSIVVDLVDIVLSAMQQYKQRWPSPDVVLQYLLRDQAFKTDTTDQELTLRQCFISISCCACFMPCILHAMHAMYPQCLARQCLELDEALPAVTAEELASKDVNLMSLEQAQCYIEYYNESRKNSSKTAETSANIVDEGGRQSSTGATISGPDHMGGTGTACTQTGGECELTSNAEDDNLHTRMERIEDQLIKLLSAVQSFEAVQFLQVPAEAR